MLEKRNSPLAHIKIFAFEKGLLPVRPAQTYDVVLPKVKAEVSRDALGDMIQHKPLAIGEESQGAQDGPVARTGFDCARRAFREWFSAGEFLREKIEKGGAQYYPNGGWEVVESLHCSAYYRC